MGRALVIIRGSSDREKAKRWIDRAPYETRIEFKSSKRTTPQNDRMWAMLTAISDQLVWHGAKYPPEDWKDYFMHSLSGARFMPHDEGGMIPIGRRTSRLTKDEHSDLTALIEAFAARQGVDLGQDEAAA
jgi:hypothetical protein